MDPADRRLMNVRLYRLQNVEEMAQMHPGRFQIAELEQRRNLGPAFVVKLIFLVDPAQGEGPEGERMWVQVERRWVGADGRMMYRGRLRNEPAFIGGALPVEGGDALAYDALVVFEPKHIADYRVAPDDIQPVAPRPTEEQKTYSGEFVLDPWGQAGDPKRRS